MNKGQNQPPHGGGRRRRRRGGGGGQHRGPHQHQGQPQGQQQGGGGGGGGRRRRNRRGPAAFVGPMDHSYRQAQNGEQPRFGGQPGRVPQFFPQPEMAPLPVREDAPVRIYAFIEDLFFLTKIQDTAKKLNVKVQFVKTPEDVFGKVDEQGGEAPSLVMVDLNNVNAKPLVAVPKLKARFKRATSIVGFVSHVQGDLKLKAQEAGCDVVMPRSAFSQMLPQLLRRHGAPEDIEESQAQFGLGSGPQ